MNTIKAARAHAARLSFMFCRVGWQRIPLTNAFQLSIEAVLRAMSATIVVPLMVADRLAAVVGDEAGNEGSDLEAILLPARGALDAFEAVGVRHAVLPVAWPIAATASR